MARRVDHRLASMDGLLILLCSSPSGGCAWLKLGIEVVARGDKKVNRSPSPATSKAPPLLDLPVFYTPAYDTFKISTVKYLTTMQLADKLLVGE